MAIIMCPGGGYRGLGMDGEGYDMAPWFCGQGITYMVLKYRMPNGHWEVPVSDAEQAIRMVRQHAKEWNVDPYKVGLMGASAGGHLTATLATHYNSETRPDFQILLYPVVTMMQVTRGNTRTALLKLAKYYRSKFNPVLVGITGSVGKTTTKEMIALVLSEKYKTLKTQGNLNNENRFT